MKTLATVTLVMVILATANVAGAGIKHVSCDASGEVRSIVWKFTPGNAPWKTYAELFPMDKKITIEKVSRRIKLPDNIGSRKIPVGLEVTIIGENGDLNYLLKDSGCACHNDDLSAAAKPTICPISSSISPEKDEILKEVQVSREKELSGLQQREIAFKQSLNVAKWLVISLFLTTMAMFLVCCFLAFNLKRVGGELTEVKKARTYIRYEDLGEGAAIVIDMEKKGIENPSEVFSFEEKEEGR